MKITPRAIDIMRAQISEAPLASDELRRVIGIGNLFISHNRLPVDDDGVCVRLGWTYWFQYSQRIDGELYYFYGGTPDPVEEVLQHQSEQK